jgi:hypothetical protein
VCLPALCLGTVYRLYIASLLAVRRDTHTVLVHKYPVLVILVETSVYIQQ